MYIFCKNLFAVGIISLFILGTALAQGTPVAVPATTPAVTPVVAAVVASAPVSTAPTISGFIDTTYNYNLSAGNMGTQTNIGRSFDGSSDTFLLNNVQLKFAGTASKEATYVIKLDAGTDNQVAASTGLANGGLIEEAYLVYAPAAWPAFSLKVGKMVTQEGIEVIESGADPTISRGYLFGLAECFSHTGALASLTVNSMLSVSAGVINGWDSAVDNNRSQSGIGQLALNCGDPLSVSLSCVYGPEQAGSGHQIFNQRTSADLVIVTKILPMTVLNLQGNYGQEQFGDQTIPNNPANVLSTWRGVGVQPIITLNSAWSVGLRYEQFVDSPAIGDPGRTGAGTLIELNTFTITPTWQIADKTTVRAEYRYDQQSLDTTNVFTDLTTGPGMRNNQSTASMEFIQSF